MHQKPSQSAFESAIYDLLKGFSLWRIWLSLSWEELKATYSRSLLGIVWITLSFAGFIFVKIIIFGSMLTNTDPRYYNAYLATGFMVWQFLFYMIASASDIFISSKNWIENESLPLSLYIYKNVAREFYNFLFNGVVIIAVFLYLQLPPKPNFYLIVPAVLILLLNAVWIKIFLGVVSTRYRDIAHFVRTIMTAMLFLTPIFWMPSQMGNLIKFLWWNPLFHYIEIFRSPLIDNEIKIESWYFVGSLTVIGWVLAIWVFTTHRRRIAFWV